MKTKPCKKLNVTKATVANLETQSLDDVKGGKAIRSLLNDCETDCPVQCYSVAPTCPELCW